MDALCNVVVTPGTRYHSYHQEGLMVLQTG